MNRIYNLADLLEKTAAYIDELEARPLSVDVEKTAAQSPSNEVADLFRAATGEDPTQGFAEKLASDPSLMTEFRKMARNASRPDPMGGPVSDGGYDDPSAGARSNAAEDRFLNWIVNS